MIEGAFLIPVVVALLALIGVLFTVVSQRQKNRADERMSFMQAVLVEVQSLRTAEQLNDTRVLDILDQLDKAKRDILDCLRERNELALKILQLETRIADHERIAQLKTKGA